MSNLVEIKNLNIRFSGERTVHAVNDLSLSLGEASGEWHQRFGTADNFHSQVRGCCGDRSPADAAG